MLQNCHHAPNFWMEKMGAWWNKMLSCSNVFVMLQFFFSCSQIFIMLLAAWQIILEHDKNIGAWQRNGRKSGSTTQKKAGNGWYKSRKQQLLGQKWSLHVCCVLCVVRCVLCQVCFVLCTGVLCNSALCHMFCVFCLVSCVLCIMSCVFWDVSFV